MSESSLYRPAGSTAADGWTLSITPQDAGWDYSGLRVLDLAAGGSRTFQTGEDELVVLPLWGSVRVSCEHQAFDLRGRSGVFEGPTDFAYVGRDSQVTVSSPTGGRSAIPSARASRRLPFRYGPSEAVPVELRGSGSCSRQVNGFCMPGGFEADRLMACEVLVPSGNWSSYPPHKHDEERSGETELEEIYYYELAAGRAGPSSGSGGAAESGIAYQRVYGTVERPIDVLAEVRSGDVVLIPHGWHGPAMAAPGYDLYFLNVMAGPGRRSWLVSDDPAHAWVKETWSADGVDPRLPFGERR